MYHSMQYCFSFRLTATCTTAMLTEQKENLPLDVSPGWVLGFKKLTSMKHLDQLTRFKSDYHCQSFATLIDLSSIFRDFFWAKTPFLLEQKEKLGRTTLNTFWNIRYCELLIFKMLVLTKLLKLSRLIHSHKEELCPTGYNVLLYSQLNV